ncbi:MAG TPA: glutamate--cysteine ligase [Verrucomicrobiales bacterium]|nr:glutamate--cysteine ligase [Verrucomicrobiales bacterium]
MPIKFNASENPTIGVEVELQIVDPATRHLVPKGAELIAAMNGDPHVKSELLQSTVELNTSVCRNVKEIQSDLERVKTEVQSACEKLECNLISAGTHPFSTWPEQLTTDEVRYQKLINRVQWPAQRLMIFGLHVHVGMDSGEKAVAVANQLTNFIPQFLALSASSPFWQGNDTGLASVRSKVFETLPTAGLPEHFANWGEFQMFMNTLVNAGAIESIREVWWDIRPHPGFGTVELRMCDGLPTMEELLAVAALMHCTTVHLGEQYENGELPPPTRHWILRENKWRAARWGLDARIIQDEAGNLESNRTLIHQLIETLTPLSEQLNCAEELANLDRILDQGPSYLRQRKVFEQTGQLVPVVDALVDEWKTGVRHAP